MGRNQCVECASNDLVVGCNRAAGFLGIVAKIKPYVKTGWLKEKIKDEEKNHWTISRHREKKGCQQMNWSLRCLDHIEELLWDAELMKRCWSAWRHLWMEEMWCSGGTLVLVKWNLCRIKGILSKQGYDCGQSVSFILQQHHDPKHNFTTPNYTYIYVYYSLILIQ